MEKTARYIFLLCLIGGLAASCKSPDTPHLSSFLPPGVNGWSASGEDRMYDSQTIYEYINRAGEVYLAFNFQSLLARLYSREDQPTIHADFFDMGSSKNAFGIFSFNPEGQEAGIGQGSTFKGRLLVFWKDRFFVTLVAESETEEAKEALLAMGRKISSGIDREGQIPALVSRLPRDFLVPRRIHYFFSHMILNIHTFFSGENILQLGENVDAVLGRYKDGEDTYSLLLVEYPDEKRASAVYNNFMVVYIPDAGEKGLVQIENGKWMGTKTSGNLLMVVWDVSSEMKVDEVFSKVK